MTKQNIIDMALGHRLVSAEYFGEIYFDDDYHFQHQDSGGMVTVVDQFSKMWDHDGWHRKLEKEKMRLMTHDEILGFITHNPHIAVKVDEQPWSPPGNFRFNLSIDRYEYAHIDEKGNIGEPHKFEVEE